MGIRNCEVRIFLFLPGYPAVGAMVAIFLSRTEFEAVVTKLKVHHMRTAVPIRFGTAFAAFLARLLVENPETWPAIRTTAQVKTLTC